MTNLGVLLYVQAATGNLAIAGASAATNMLGTGCGSVVQGHWFDRFGVGRTLCALAAAYVPLTAAMVVLVESHGPLWLLLPMTLAQGLSAPLMGVATRAMLPRLVPEGPLREALLRYWTISFEVCYVLAPALTATLAASMWAGAGLLCAALGLAAAAIAYARLPAVRGHRGEACKPGGAAKTHGRAGLVTLGIAALAFGVVVGFVVITATATAAALGAPQLVGFLFALMTLCSVGGGILFGVRGWPRPTDLQLPALLLVSAAALLIPLGGAHIATLAACVALAGATFAPQLTAQSVICDRIVPQDRAGVSFGWLTTAATAGAAAGQFAGGALSQLFSPQVAAMVGAMTITVAAAIITARRATLTTSPMACCRLSTPYAKAEPARRCGPAAVGAGVGAELQRDRAGADQPGGWRIQGNSSQKYSTPGK